MLARIEDTREIEWILMQFNELHKCGLTNPHFANPLFLPGFF
jgi:hypothetical protein